MFRTLPVALLLAATPAARAQPLTPLTAASGLGGFGGGPRPNTPALTAPGSVRGGLFGGFVPPGFRGPGYPFSGIWGGFGGGYPYYPYSGYGYPAVVVPVPVPVPVYVGPPAPPPIMLSNEFPAVLVLQFPAPAEVWVNGTKNAGDPVAEWTLTSPVLKAGGEFTFDVKARWTAGGKTFEREESITVPGGRRSRLLVVAGTEIKE